MKLATGWRILRWSLAVLVLLTVFVVVGFRIWLREQPAETRSGIEGISRTEFARVLWDLAFPPSQMEAGAWDRRPIPGRGHTPWVLRSSLDRRTRMLHFALAPNQWASYSTENGGLYQFWEGSIEWSGAVYDTRHGPEPESRGAAFVGAPDRNPWSLRLADGSFEPAQVQYLGHRFTNGGASAFLRLRLRRPDGTASLIIEEEPAPVSDAGRIGLERSFRVIPEQDASILPVLALPPRQDTDDIQTTFARDGEDRVVFESSSGVVTHWFEKPHLELTGNKRWRGLQAAHLFEDEDCVSCHGSHERVVGPGYREIAERYADEEREVVVARLAEKVLDGGVGSWGSVPMPPHPNLGSNEAKIMIRSILDTKEGEELPAALTQDGMESTYDFDVLPRLKTLHPSLTSRSLVPRGFKPKVGGLDFLPDGRLLVATWDPDGSIFVVENWQDPDAEPVVRRVAEGLHEALGLAVVGSKIYVMQKQEVTQLIDHDGDDRIDEYRAMSQDWAVTSNFHEFGFGLVHHEGWLYGSISACVMPGGKSCPEQTDDRGTVFRVSTEDGRFERVASGFRTPNGIGLHPDGSLLVTDNQGDWLPASKLLRIEQGGFYGWRAPARKSEPFPDPLPPVLLLPQNEVGNSPTEPIVLEHGPYRGHVLFGDVYNGGIKRASLQQVGSVWQGSAFHFTGGLRGGVNRLVESTNGRVIAGQVGSTGNWADPFGLWHGLELLEFSDEQAFEPLRVDVTANGLEVEFSKPLAADSPAESAAKRVEQWRYIPTEIYGGPKFDLESLTVTSSTLSADRRRLRLVVPGMKTDRVLYLQLAPGLRSETDEALWVRESWVTINAIPNP